ncbi:intercellular adhesion molecule 1-like [Oryzias latipes]|uniref:intercellular adhesion molecule 1-like n=1 Tax=Oryzias latipes TaxID=8090 RepID=UPI000CE1C231|nr:intercellular adhesion molecule 1-like [Oryzias latipes]
MDKMIGTDSTRLLSFPPSIDYTCPDKPVFTPSSLVVKYGDPAFATCVACQSDCDESLANLEASGYKEKNGSTLKWKVSSLTEWKSDPICYYIDHNGTQCCSTLKVTLYQMPTNVSISVLNHSGPMLEKSQYNLVCEVGDVAPAENLTVTFYRGQTELGKAQYSRTTSRKPENGSFSLSLNATKEDDGAQFSCGAKLELGPEGPQRPLVVRSQSLTATVHYGPDLQATVNPDQITVKEKGTLRLNCSAVGNPNPSYIWTLPFRGPHFNDGVLTIETASSQHEGQYNCTVSNSVKTVSVLFNVKVQSLEATSSAAPQADSSFTTARSTVTTPSGPTSDVTPQFSLQVHQIILCSVIFVSLQASAYSL